MYLIDTNIFLELLLNRKEAKSCGELLEKVSEGEIKAVVSSFTIHAIEVFLGRKYNILQKFLQNIINSSGLIIYTTTIDEELEAIVMAEKVGLDFDDGIQYFIAKKLRVQAIISFDKHFDNTDLKRKEPREVLKEYGSGRI